MNHADVRVEHVDEIRESLDEDPRAARPAVSNVIDTVHGVAERNEVIDNVCVAPAVFCESVDDEERGPRFALR